MLRNVDKKMTKMNQSGWLDFCQGVQYLSKQRSINAEPFKHSYDQAHSKQFRCTVILSTHTKSCFKTFDMLIF